MQSLPLSTTNIYMIIYGIIFLLFIVAFASQPYLTVSSDLLDINVYYTNIKAIALDGYKKDKFMIINNPKKSDLFLILFLILILAIIIFICFGGIFLTLFLNAKKLNKFFNILILLAMIIIIVILHVIYSNNSKIRTYVINILKEEVKKQLDGGDDEFIFMLNELINLLIDNTKITIKTTETAGYGLTMTCTVLLFITVVSSFFYN